MRIHEVANLSGLTVRTLQYYDRIGLLKPSQVAENGYRNYYPEDLDLLQQILFFRELDFPLNQIKDILHSPNYDRTEALKKHKELLLKKRESIDQLIDLVNSRLEGEDQMNLEAFNHSEYEAQKDAYVKEVKERWGNTNAYQEYEEKSRHQDSNDDALITRDVDAIFKKFATIRNLSLASPEAQSLVKAWQDYITDNFYQCTNEILSCLGMMYVEDERFRNNINQHGDGTAEFVAKSIECYCGKSTR